MRSNRELLGIFTFISQIFVIAAHDGTASSSIPSVASPDNNPISLNFNFLAGTMVGAVLAAFVFIIFWRHASNDARTDLGKNRQRNSDLKRENKSLKERKRQEKESLDQLKSSVEALQTKYRDEAISRAKSEQAKLFSDLEELKKQILMLEAVKRGLLGDITNAQYQALRPEFERLNQRLDTMLNNFVSQTAGTTNNAIALAREAGQALDRNTQATAAIVTEHRRPVNNHFTLDFLNNIALPRFSFPSLSSLSNSKKSYRSSSRSLHLTSVGGQRRRPSIEERDNSDNSDDEKAVVLRRN